MAAYEWWDNASPILAIPGLAAHRPARGGAGDTDQTGKPRPHVTLASSPAVSWASCPRRSALGGEPLQSRKHK